MRLRVLSAGILCMGLMSPVTGLAQERWAWPDTCQNLQVLPSDWSGQRLRPVMRGFAEALGVRCVYCHDGEEGAHLADIDFVSDANPNKARAREMLRMLASINEHLDKIQPSGPNRVNMWCHTCHRGRPRPMTLTEELDEQFETGGVDAALSRFRDLRTRFYGKGAYDFSEGVLNGLGYRLLEAGDTDGAVAVFSTNADTFPASGNVWDSLGEAYVKRGDPDAARQCYARVLELDPSNDNARHMLETITAEPTD